MNSATELWYVQLSDGDVHRVTLDQLDEGFQAGHIGANTMVLAAGAYHWTKLGELAGIDDSAPAPGPPRHAPAVLAPPTIAPSRAAPSVLAPPVFGPPVLAPPVLSLPALSGPHSQAPRFLESHRPVSVDLSDLDFAAGLPGRSRRRWLMALLGVALMGGLAGVGVERPGLLRAFAADARAGSVAAKSWISVEVPRRLFGKQPASQIAAVPADASVSPPAPAIPLPTPAPLPSTQSAALVPPVVPSTESSGGDTKAPVHGPKAHARKVRAKAAASSDSLPKSPSSFTTSGNKFDPLSSGIQ